MMTAVVYMRARWQKRERERMEEIMAVTAAGHTDVVEEGKEMCMLYNTTSC